MVINYARNEREAAAAVEEVGAENALAVQADVADEADQETIDRAAQAPPLQRLGTPEDIAGVVSFLAGPDGRWVNGQVLRANGGVI